MSRKGLLGAALTAALMFGGVSAPAAIAQDTTTTSDDSGDNGLWGLAGLIGLVGLAGLKRHDRQTRTDDRTDARYRTTA